jgi:hypothetical protein
VVGAVAALAGEGPKLQRAVVAELEKADLRDLGISADQVLKGARVQVVFVACSNCCVFDHFSSIVVSFHNNSSGS